VPCSSAKLCEHAALATTIALIRQDRTGAGRGDDISGPQPPMVGKLGECTMVVTVTTANGNPWTIDGGMSIDDGDVRRHSEQRGNKDDQVKRGRRR